MPHTLLCVDDEIAGLNVRRIFLESVGYKVVIAPDGPRALEIFAAHELDAVVLDYSMPGMDGGEVAARLRGMRPSVPIILYSACLSVPSDALRCVDAFVTKGQSPAVLLAELRNLIGSPHLHTGWQGQYVAFANPDRMYIEVTDGFCRLLGYSRHEMLRMRIDQVAATPDEVPERWRHFVNRGALEGEIVLRHRSGALVPVAYKAKLFPDGCMVSRMEPLALGPGNGVAAP
jgi:CheY-like chemotaxis protein